ncbi:uncharacterized protein LOC9655422 isoform X2 [Selaginella moellendorffii]|uniref:uncharacterized protein LOC9655422 isoform X2 n=1 Tax=Selaginella moellendorffii TaxID=88036 RepID=UPI000D1C9AA4|nr:uncharacterized protein LOC9655422 isoform X2 [Selaginella moellendorffii]|eukprot:XP_024521390.1 uncharacterized protein LOC9655422 isoform X2 [Selaginella moellendorffii]
MAASMQLLVQASAHPIGARSPLSSAFHGSVVHQHDFSARAGNFRAKGRVVCQVDESSQSKTDRWQGLGTDTSDDQQDITRGKGMVDSLYQGPQGGGTQTAVMSSLEYLNTAQRVYSMDNTIDGLYIAPAFMDKLVIHISKNFMALPNIKVPLILGVWGGKGQGKSFQCELVFSKLGINPIAMSAGELESGNAGEPAKLIRQRYREAADIIKKKGQMCVLFINDLDAGAGRMGGTTQYTVNNQMVNATLMNIADNPTNVQLPGIYTKEELPRVPIIVTGNDFSTLYAPLIRDGRMEKFYWAPTREDRIGVCKGIFRSDEVPDEDIVKLVDTFPGQSIDFFGALRARVYDDEVRKWITQVGVENIGPKLVNSKDGPPTFPKPPMTIDKLLEYGNMLVKEQENVKRYHLADKYMKGSSLGDANEDEREKDTFYGKAAQAVKLPVPEGCADPFARNFDPTARSDDGTCEYDFAEKTPATSSLKQDNLYGKAAQQINLPVPEGCTDSNAINFDPTARSDDGTCVYDFSKGQKAEKNNLYGKAAQQINLPVPEGCTDPNAANFDPTARSDDGTCEYDFSAEASKPKISVADKSNIYGKAAQQVNIPVPEGCADPNAANYDPTARSDNGSCIYDFDEKVESDATKKSEVKALDEKKSGIPEKVIKVVLAILSLPFSRGKSAGAKENENPFLSFSTGKRSFVAQAVYTLGALHGTYDNFAFADEEPCPTVTRKVFLDISIDGEPAGRVVVGLYEDDVPVGARRFGEIAAGQKGVSYRKRDFYKITGNYIQNGGLRTFSLSGRAKDTAQFAGGLDAKALASEMKTLDETGKRPKNVKGAVSIMAIDATKPPAKPKLIARDGKFEVVYEESRPDPNGTEFCIAFEDAPELDPTNSVVGRVVEGLDVVRKIASTRVVKDNTSNLYFRTAKLIGDTRAVVAERGFNRPYAKIVISQCGILDN